MPKNEEVVSISAAVGKRVASLRSEAGLNQDDLARAARDCGLSWNRSAIAGLETGRRQLTLGEALLLPFMLVRAGIEVELAELIDGPSPWFEVAPPTRESDRGARMGRATARSVLQGRVVKGSKAGDFDSSSLDVPYTRAAREKRRFETDYVAKLAARHSASSLQVEQALRDAGGEAETKAARRLGMSPGELALVAWLRWGCSLTAKRDEMVAAEHDVASLSPASLRTHRGHATQKLVSELDQAIRVAEALREARREARGGAR